MSDICLRLAEKYETDGAKYDLFNCIPNVPCCSAEHDHDTESGVEGLELLLKSIYEKERRKKTGTRIN